MNCKICHGSAHRIKDFSPTYFICDNCNYIFLDDTFYLTHQEEKERYLQHNNDDSNQGYVTMLENFIVKTITPYKASVERILDFGCGHGPVLAKLLKKHGFYVDLYDKYFFNNEQVFDYKYDIITATEVFEHLHDPIAILKTLTTMLSHKGKIAIMTLFHPNNEELFKNWWYRRDNTHISFYTPKTFNIISNIVGLDVQLCDLEKTIILSIK